MRPNFVSRLSTSNGSFTLSMLPHLAHVYTLFQSSHFGTGRAKVVEFGFTTTNCTCLKVSKAFSKNPFVHNLALQSFQLHLFYPLRFDGCPYPISKLQFNTSFEDAGKGCRIWLYTYQLHLL